MAKARKRSRERSTMIDPLGADERSALKAAKEAAEAEGRDPTSLTPGAVLPVTGWDGRGEPRNTYTGSPAPLYTMKRRPSRMARRKR